MITPVKLEDLDSISKELGELFYKEFTLPGGFKLDVFLYNWRVLFMSNIAVMWKLTVEDKAVGFLGGILLPDINNGDLVATELFWYVHPDHRGGIGGIKLLSTFENWSKDMGAKRIVMGALNNSYRDALTKLYIHRGYASKEIHFVKEL